MTKTILITGATGNTGGSAIDALLERGHTGIRAMLRTDDSRAKALRDRGVETVFGRPKFRSDRGKAIEKAQNQPP
ncbi:MAG: hypothetical protein B7Z81_14485 [Acidocella sp. 20-61-6]|nr:MAG: hypothetical protein B7Z81_14485 [Acidocella sp. 20-61-6]